MAVLDGRHYLSELGMKRAANTNRVLPSTSVPATAPAWTAGTGSLRASVALSRSN